MVPLFVRYVVRVFRESLPLAHTEQRWGQVALQLALSCPSRHYAGRSFQIFRALHVCVTSQMLSDILPRLVDTVADPGEDMQVHEETPQKKVFRIFLNDQKSFRSCFSEVMEI